MWEGGALADFGVVALAVGLAAQQDVACPRSRMSVSLDADRKAVGAGQDMLSGERQAPLLHGSQPVMETTASMCISLHRHCWLHCIWLFHIRRVLDES